MRCFPDPGVIRNLDVGQEGSEHSESVYFGDAAVWEAFIKIPGELVVPSVCVCHVSWRRWNLNFVLRRIQNMKFIELAAEAADVILPNKLFLKRHSTLKSLSSSGQPSEPLSLEAKIDELLISLRGPRPPPAYFSARNNIFPLWASLSFCGAGTTSETSDLVGSVSRIRVPNWIKPKPEEIVQLSVGQAAEPGHKQAVRILMRMLTLLTWHRQNSIR